MVLPKLSMGEVNDYIETGLFYSDAHILNFSETNDWYPRNGDVVGISIQAEKEDVQKRFIIRYGYGKWFNFGVGFGKWNDYGEKAIQVQQPKLVKSQSEKTLEDLEVEKEEKLLRLAQQHEERRQYGFAEEWETRTKTKNEETKEYEVEERVVTQDQAYEELKKDIDEWFEQEKEKYEER